jgi:hypothetical protein
VLAEDREGHPGVVQQLGGGLGDLLGAVVDRAGAPGPEDVLVLAALLLAGFQHGDVEVELLGPLLALGLADAPGVAGVLDVLEHDAGFLREARLHHRLVAAQVDDGVDVLDVDRALLDAGAAGGARPQHVVVDDRGLAGRVADQRDVDDVAGLGLVDLPSRNGPLAYMWSRRSWISILGLSGLPVFQAGHCDWHRRTPCRSGSPGTGRR